MTQTVSHFHSHSVSNQKHSSIVDIILHCAVSRLREQESIDRSKSSEMNIVLLWWLCTCLLSLTVATVNISHREPSPRFNYAQRKMTDREFDSKWNEENGGVNQHGMDATNASHFLNVSRVTGKTRQGIITIPLLVAAGVAGAIAVAVTVAVVTAVVSFVTWYYWPQISYALHTTGHYIYCHVWKHCSVNGTQSLSLDIGDNYMVSTVSTLVYCRLWTQCGEQWSVHMGDTIWAIGYTVYCRVWVHCPDNSTGVAPSSLHMAETIWWAGHDGLYCHLWAHCPNTTWTMHVGTTLFCRLWKHCDDENGTAGYSLHVEETMHKVKCKLWPWAHCNDTTNGTLVGSVMGLGALGALGGWAYCKLGGHCGGNTNIGIGIGNGMMGEQWSVGTGTESTFTLGTQTGGSIGAGGIDGNFQLGPAVESSFTLGDADTTTAGAAPVGQVPMPNGHTEQWTMGNGVDTTFDTASFPQRTAVDTVSTTDGRKAIVRVR